MLPRREGPCNHKAPAGGRRVHLKKVALLSEFVILSRLQAAKNLPWRFP